MNKSRAMQALAGETQFLTNAGFLVRLTDLAVLLACWVAFVFLSL